MTQSRYGQLKRLKEDVKIEGGLYDSKTRKPKKLSPNDKLKRLFCRSPFKETLAMARCAKTDHRILVTNKGQIVLLDHSKEELDVDLALKGLGSKHRCKCLTVRKNWIKYVSGNLTNSNSIPKALISELFRARLRHTNRKKSKTSKKLCVADQYTLPMTIRASFIGKVIKRETDRDPLIKGLNKDLGSKATKLTIKVPDKDTERSRTNINQCDIVLDLPAFTLPTFTSNKGVTGKLGQSGPTSFYYRERSLKSLSVLQNWYEDVYKKKLAIVDGCLVTHAKEHHSSNPLSQKFVVNMNRLGWSPDGYRLNGIRYYQAEVTQSHLGDELVNLVTKY